MRVIKGFAAVALLACASYAEGVIKIGIIGLDTSHALAFTKAVNATNPRSGVRGLSDRRSLSAGQPGYRLKHESLAELHRDG